MAKLTLRGKSSPLGLEDLSCLNRWPDGTSAYDVDEGAINDLLKLCNLVGFGRICELANAMHDIWHNPSNIGHWEELRLERLKDCADTTDTR